MMPPVAQAMASFPDITWDYYSTESEITTLVTLPFSTAHLLQCTNC